MSYSNNCVELTRTPLRSSFTDARKALLSSTKNVRRSAELIVALRTGTWARQSATLVFPLQKFLGYAISRGAPPVKAATELRLLSTQHCHEPGRREPTAVPFDQRMSTRTPAAAEIAKKSEGGAGCKRARSEQGNLECVCVCYACVCVCMPEQQGMGILAHHVAAPAPCSCRQPPIDRRCAHQLRVGCAGHLRPSQPTGRE